MKKGFLWGLSVLLGAVTLFGVLIAGYFVLDQNNSAKEVAVTASSQSATETSETSSSSTTSSSTTEDSQESAVETSSEQGMNLSEMKNGDFSSISGTWYASDGSTMVVEADGTVGKAQYITSVKDGVPEGSYVSAYLVNKSHVGKSYTIDFVTASASGGKTADHIIVYYDSNGSGSSGKEYYRNIPKDSVPLATASEKDYMMAYATDTIAKYRKDINRSLAERKDYIADDFTSKDNSYYKDTVDYIVNQSASDGIKAYHSTTDSITNFQYTKDTITFTLNSTTTVEYTDGRASTTSSNVRNFTLKMVDGIFRIEKF